MIKEEQKIMRPSDLKAGQSKVVVYYYNGCTIIVPDQSWDMKGDLSKLPQGLQDVLAEPVRNHVLKTQAVIENKGRTAEEQRFGIPSEVKAIADINANGFSVVSSTVIIEGETDSHGNKIR